MKGEVFSCFGYICFPQFSKRELPRGELFMFKFLCIDKSRKGGFQKLSSIKLGKAKSKSGLCTCKGDRKEAKMFHFPE